MARPSGHRRLKRWTKRQLTRFSDRFSEHPGWSIGVLSGPSLSALAPVAGLTNPVVDRAHAGRRTDFVADPFALHVDGVWHLFYEAMDLRTDRGHIELSVSRDLERWQHHGVVLREPFHLSYPHVFVHDGEVHLIPEAWESGAVRLYRADPFPSRWVHVRDLVTGPVLLDPTVFRAGDRWWMFVDTSPTVLAGELRLLMATDLYGPWVEHPASPVIHGDPARSRPAGPVATVDGALVRFAQDCSRIYGGAVRAFRIDRLDPGGYAETELDGPVLAGSGHGWNAVAMHQLDLHPDGQEGWVAFVDGHAGPRRA